MAKNEKMYRYIVKTSGVCGGKPRIDGHRIRVQDISVNYEFWKMSPDEISDAYPGLTLAQIHAALAYYYDHREEILGDIKSDQEFVEKYKRKHPERVR
jgi:uncharacterized protein (DUF433 family)